jgi:hypothetical protein
MKNLQRLCATILLVLVFCIPAYAADVEGPSTVTTHASQPTDCTPPVTTAKHSTIPGDPDSLPLMGLALDFLVSTLLMY